MNSRVFITGIAALALSLVAIIASGEEREEQIPLDKVPAKVRAAIKKHSEGAKIRKVEIVITKVYEVELRKDGKTTEIVISRDGQILSVNKDEKKSEANEDDEDDEKGEAKSEKKEAKESKKAVKKSEAKEEDENDENEKGDSSPGIPLDKAPKAVQATVKKLLGKGKVVKLAKESDGNYELDYQVDGVTQAAIVTPDGKIDEEEVTVDVSTLPKAVIKAVKQRYPNGKIAVAETSKTKKGLVYEIQVTDGKKSHTITVSPDGELR